MTDSKPNQAPNQEKGAVNGSALLDELVECFRRHLSLPDGASEALALWVLFSHTFDCWDISPRLAVTSPIPECGKTTVLRILKALVPCPMLTSNVSSAVIYRLIERDRPTLLIDEADTFLSARDELAGILNSGHTTDSAVVLRCCGENFEPRPFSTWAPMAIAKIGKLPPPLESRSILINMRKARRDEKIERFTPKHRAALVELGKRAQQWAKDSGVQLRDADPAMPKELHCRAADNWRSLIAIADLAGAQWPRLARTVAVQLSAGDRTVSNQEELLADIRDIFLSKGTDRISSQDLCSELRKLEHRPWLNWNTETFARGITANQIAGLLRPFGIRPVPVRFGPGPKDTARGYKREWFEDAWSRYLPECDGVTDAGGECDGKEAA